MRRAEKETGRRLPVDDEARELMKATADGDGRYILNLAESVLNYAKEGEVFDRESLLKIIRSRAPVYDTNHCAVPMSTPPFTGWRGWWRPAKTRNIFSAV